MYQRMSFQAVAVTVAFPATLARVEGDILLSRSHGSQKDPYHDQKSSAYPLRFE